MTPFELGDVALVPLSFTDQSATKQRPAVVVSSAAYHRERPDVLILAISSRARPGGAIAERVIRRRLGRLQADDQHALRKLLDEIIGSPAPDGS